MKNHYEIRLNELNKNGWFANLCIKLTNEIKYRTNFIDVDFKQTQELNCIQQDNYSQSNDDNEDYDGGFKLKM